MAEQLSRRSDYVATFSAHLTHELNSRRSARRPPSEGNESYASFMAQLECTRGAVPPGQL
jgi:hypothetical protein